MNSRPFSKLIKTFNQYTPMPQHKNELICIFFPLCWEFITLLTHFCSDAKSRQHSGIICQFTCFEFSARINGRAKLAVFLFNCWHCPEALLSFTHTGMKTQLVQIFSQGLKYILPRTLWVIMMDGWDISILTWNMNCWNWHLLTCSHVKTIKGSLSLNSQLESHKYDIESPMAKCGGETEQWHETNTGNMHVFA